MGCNCGNDCGCPNPIIPEGQQGLPGAAATIAIGTTTTLPPGSPATATNSGTAQNAILNFGLPQGEEGDAGDDGYSNEVTFSAVNPSTFPATGNSGLHFNTATGHVWFFPIGGPWTDEGLYVGADGTDGINAFTLTTANFVQPSPIGSVTVQVLDSTWMAIGQPMFVSDGVDWSGYTVTVKPTTTSVTLLNSGWIGNVAGGTTINSGAMVSPTGRPGVDGTNGVNGVTPTLRSGTSAPANALGVDGDWYIQQVNTGKWQVYFKTGGFYVAFATGQITANRMIGWSTTTDPNTGSITGNPNDTYWTFIGTTVSMWAYTGVTWVVAFSYTTGGGGGGGDTLQSAAGNSPVGAFGQQTGTYNWMLQRTIYWEALNAIHTINGGTYQFNLAYPKTLLQVVNNVVLNHTALGGDAEWTFELYNPDPVNTWYIVYSAGVWTVVPGVAQPTFIGPGERIQLVCRKHNNKICLTQVIANVSTIP